MRTWIVWGLICCSSHVWADKKEKIAILGLEVQGNRSTIDAESTRVAQDLTVALRTRPKAAQGPYQWTPGSEKELFDEKVYGSCENEDKDCMAAIGKKLGADVLVYGRIERKQLAGQAGYQVSLKMLKVGTATMLPGWVEFIPLSETNGTKLQEWARKGYKKITMDFDGGTLVIAVKNVERGTILIDGEERGNIVNNRGEVPSLPEGRYNVAVVAAGYARWSSDEKITIRNGETTTEEITLIALKHGEAPLCDPSVSICDGKEIGQDPKRGRGCAGCGTVEDPSLFLLFAALARRPWRRRRAAKDSCADRSLL
jgi:hypothetical protein